MLRERKRIRGNLRVWTAALTVAAVGMATVATSAQALPAGFWGIDSQATPTLSQLQRVKRGGVSSLRVPIPWGAIQPTPDGPLNWSGIDSYVTGAAQAGLDVLPFLYGPPSWAVPQVHIPNSTVPAPRTLPVKTAAQRSAWSNFLKQAVARYGPNGSFWAENPGIPKRPIRTWQIGNEENFFYFVAHPSPSDYGKLVKISHAAIKGADRGAKIILCGLFALPRQKPPKAYPAYQFLQQMYKSNPGVKADFDGVSLHPYVRDYKYLTPEIDQVRAVLKKAGDNGVPLWITEIGWSSSPPDHTDAFEKGPQGQAKQLKGAFGLLRKNQRKWHVQRVYWFSLDDAVGSCNFCDGSGLFGAGFTPKPAWYAFVKFTGGHAN